jgi:colicin import membrane protein
MDDTPQQNKYLIASCLCHLALLLAIVVEYNFAEPIAVIENTNQHDVISAVVLGDTAKSKILPHEQPTVRPEPKPEPKPEPPKEVAKVEPKPEPKPEVKPEQTPDIKAAEAKKILEEEAIALKAEEKKQAEKKLAEKKIAEKKLEEKKLAEKKLAEKKAQELKKKQQELFAKDLLADIKKVNDKKAQPKKVDLQAKFAKTLRQQSEESLRQNLLNEKITLTGKLSRQSQGVVDKYKALIIQAIGEHWLVPLQANKTLTSELMIRLAPDGRVLDVTIKRSSGDPALDSSARAAVLKSSPLPVPEGADEFEPFRQFVLKVKPENIVES